MHNVIYEYNKTKTIYNSERREYTYTTGKRLIAVRQNVCRALFIGRTENIDFTVRFLEDARQTKTHGTYILCRAFLWGRTAIIILCRAFFHGRTAIIAH
jgi:hypothetical protein